MRLKQQGVETDYANYASGRDEQPPEANRGQQSEQVLS